MTMSHKLVFNILKKMNLQDLEVSLAIVKEYKSDRVSQYKLKYVPINEQLESRLKSIVLNKVSNSNSVDEFTFDCPEPEDDQVRSINSDQTDFDRILENLKQLNPEEDKIQNIDELVSGTKAYMILLRNRDGIQVVGFKTIPENWKMKKHRGLIPLLFRDNQFEDLEDENVFSISSSLDLFYFENTLFIISKKQFEQGLNFREGMIEKARLMFDEVTVLNLFVNIEILTSRVGNNQRYLRKIATIMNLGHYRNPHFMQRLEKVCIDKNWEIQFNEGQIVLTEDTVDTILSLLQNKRLHSEITQEDFDVDGKIDRI